MEDSLPEILTYIVCIAGFVTLLLLFRLIACTIANLILLVAWWSLYLLTSGMVDWRDDLVGGSFFGPWIDTFSNGWRGLLKGLVYGGRSGSSSNSDNSCGGSSGGSGSSGGW